MMAIAAALTLAAGCGDDDEQGAGGSGGGGPRCEDAPLGPAEDACPAGAYVPTPASILFAPIAAVPAGEQILFNDWSVPDRVLSMAPDGSSAVEIFTAYRIWSMAVSRAGDALAFACGDPEQEQHYGINLGDAIQNTWRYDFDTQSAELVGCGAVNDECLHYGPDDDWLYTCRRYDFVQDGGSWTNRGYHVGAFDLGAGAFSWRLQSDDPGYLFLNPQVTPDGCELWFSEVVWEGSSQSRSIQKMALPGGSPELVRADAHRPRLSPDGMRYAYADSAQQGALYVADLDGSNATRIASAAGSSLTFSPDGSRLAYTVFDAALNCSHVEMVATDGSQADAPVRIRDCGQSGEFITELAWFVRP